MLTLIFIKKILLIRMDTSQMLARVILKSIFKEVKMLMIYALEDKLLIMELCLITRFKSYSIKV